MRSFYFVYDDESVAQNLLKSLASKSANVGYMRVFDSDGACGANTASAADGADTATINGANAATNSKNTLEAYADDECAYIKSILLDYQDLAARYDMVVVLGAGDMSIDLKLATELCLQIVISAKNASAIAKLAQKSGFEPVIYDGDISVLDGISAPSFVGANAFEISLMQKAKQSKKTIVLPEAHDLRVLKAASILLQSTSVNLILLGDEQSIQKLAADNGISINGAQIINNENSAHLEQITTAIYEARKAKGLQLEQAAKLAVDRNYFGTMLVKLGYADGMVSGAACSTANTIRPALQLIKTKPGLSCVSGVFLICVGGRVLVFADCAVNPSTDAPTLAQIAKATSDTAMSFGIDPRVAMLSYSTAGSAGGPSVELVEQATALAKQMGVNADGPMQFDAAIDPLTAASKMPNSSVAGRANVFVFPSLDAGNICYKAVQRTTGALAIGPVLQGLNKAVNDLSRGCLVEDIVNTVLVTAIMANDNA